MKKHDHDHSNYVGEELDLFAKATNWKSYLKRVLSPYISGDVLEVGAGIGATSVMLSNNKQCSWTCLEPDTKLLKRIEERFVSHPLPIPTRVVEGTIENIPDGARFDTILYIDVLEHIPDDQEQLRMAGNLLKKNGRIIILSPAHQWLFTPFDDAVGHFRRYTKRALASLAPGAALNVEKLLYLDCAGLLASTGNRLLLQSSMPTTAQIKFWDKTLVPLSRVLDPLTFRAVGKSVVAIYKSADH